MVSQNGHCGEDGQGHRGGWCGRDRCSCQGALGGDGIQGGEVAGVVTAAGFVHTLHSRDVFNVFLTNLIQLINFSENFEPS